MTSRLKISRGFLTADEQQALMDTTGDVRDRLVWAIMLDLGLRLSETAVPTVGDLTSRSVKIAGHGSTVRHLPTTARVRYLARQVATNYNLTDDQSPVLWRPRTIQQHFHRSLRRAGITKSGISSHSLRHSYACNLLNSGIPIHAVQALMGHQDLATTSSYLHVAEDHLTQAEAALERIGGNAHVPNVNE